MDDELWNPIPGHAGYEASTQGRIRSVDRVVSGRWGPRNYPGKVLSAWTDQDGYCRVGLGRGEANRAVSRCVLLAFRGEPGSPDLQACHRNGIRDDNRLENLYWGTSSENTLDQVRLGVHRFSGRDRCAQGHEYTEENLGETKRSGRVCLECKRDSEARRQKKLWLARTYSECDAT